MKTLLSTVALVAVSATASVAGDFSLTSWGDANGKIWTFTKDGGGQWNFYGTRYVDGLRADLEVERTRVANLASSLTAAESSVARANEIIGENALRIEELEAMLVAGAPSAAELEAANNEIAALNEEISALRIEFNAELDFVDVLYGELDAANAQVSSLTAQLTVALANVESTQADLDAANTTIADLISSPTVGAAGDVTNAHVEGLMSEVSNSGVLDYVSMDNVEELIRTGVFMLT